ncbi:MAG: T9SS type A sorting domain-containing protein [candidate division WOR-3 bacterium]|nr:T9SS type A sorting domain-containing protein [candidate division WOR-3 bacterium]
MRDPRLSKSNLSGTANEQQRRAAQRSQRKWFVCIVLMLLGAQMAVAGHDYGVTRIVSPPTTISIGASVVPACSVYNFDGDTLDYEVRARIGSSYDQTVTVTNHSPHTYRLVSFPAWTAGPLGTSTVSCSTQCADDSVPANDRCTRPTYVWSWPFGQMYVRTVVTGSLNGQPLRGTGSGKLDTTGLYPSALWSYYDTLPSAFHALPTALPAPLEAESGAVNLWRLCSGNLNMTRTFTWPSYPGDTAYAGFYSQVVGCTLQVGIAVFGQWPGPIDTEMTIGPYVMHWTQQDSTIREQGSIALIESTGETLTVNVSGTYHGVRRALPFPEVSKFYWPDHPDWANRLQHVVWCGRTMTEDHGRQIDVWGSIGGIVNGGHVSGRSWGMLDTTGMKSGYAYVSYDTLSVPLLVLAPDNCIGHGLGLAPQSTGAQNLWSLSGGNYVADRTVVFGGSDSISARVSASATGTDLRCSLQVSGAYTGPANLEHWTSSEALWHQRDSATLSDQGRAVLLTSAGDSVVGSFTTTYQGLRRRLNFDQTAEMVAQCRCSLGFLAYTWAGTVDSATVGLQQSSEHPAPRAPCLTVTPNPSLGAPVITYSLPEAGDVSLKLYDVTGSCISVLRAGRVPAGEYSTRLDASKLSRGVYVLRLDADGFSRTRKLVIER